MSFSDSLFGQLTGHNVDLLRFDAATRRRIRARLVQLQNELSIALGGVDFTNVARLSRLQSLFDQVDKILSTNYRGMRSILSSDMRDLASLEQTFSVNGMNNLFKVDIMSIALTPEKLRAIASNSNIVGAPARKWWNIQAGRTRNAFQNQIRQGFLLGESTGTLVQRIRGIATGKRQIIELANGVKKSVHVFEGGIMQVTTREAEALVRTSVQSVANEVRFQTYRANKDVIKTLQAQVTLDAATSQICQSHGAIPDEWDIETLDPIGGSNPWSGPPPWHFQCRSSLLPITKSWQELQSQGNAGGATRNQRRIARKLDNNAPKRLRSSMNGQVPRGISFDKWLKSQPKSVQLDLLGPSKRKLWKDGRLSLSQTLDQTGRPLSVSQIKTRIGRGVSLRTTPTITSEIHASAIAPDLGVDAFGKNFNPQQVLKIKPSAIGGLPVGGMYTTTLNGIIFQVVKKSKDSVTVRRFSKAKATMVSETNKKAFRIIKVKPRAGGVSVPGTKPLNPLTVDPSNYRTLRVADIFKDTSGEIWKVVRTSNRGLRVVPWDARRGRFLSKGQTLGFTSVPAKTVRGFNNATRSAEVALTKSFELNHAFKLEFTGKFHTPPPLSTRLNISLQSSIRVMSKNGFNKGLANFLSRPEMRTRVFNMGAWRKHVDWKGLPYSGRFNGTYWSGNARALGVSGSGSNPMATWIHEFGHHIDFTLIRGKASIRNINKLSQASRGKLFDLQDAAEKMLREYRTASADISKRAGFGNKVLTAGKQNDNWKQIQNSLKGSAQTSYSLRDEFEWFAESHSHYFGQSGSRKFMQTHQPETFKFFELLNSREMESLWEELGTLL